MFSSIGWVEIFVVIIIGVIVIGPERLPGVIMDVRAAIYAARKAINNAKAELNGEMSGLGAEFEQLRGPISQAAEWGRLGPRGAITKALFDGDDSAWDDFNPKKMVGDLGKPDLASQHNTTDHNGQQGNAQAVSAIQAGQQQPGFDYSQIYAEQAPEQQAAPTQEKSAQEAPQPQQVRPQDQPQPYMQPPRGRQAKAQENPRPAGGGFNWEDVT